jgi:hypothetical protein
MHAIPVFSVCAECLPLHPLRDRVRRLQRLCNWPCLRCRILSSVPNSSSSIYCAHAIRLILSFCLHKLPTECGNIQQQCSRSLACRTSHLCIEWCWWPLTAWAMHYSRNLDNTCHSQCPHWASLLHAVWSTIRHLTAHPLSAS